jgi:hypothetical protein
MKTLGLLAPLTLALACGAPPDDIEQGRQIRARLTEGTAAASGVIALINHASSTFSVLDIDVRLDRRAAKNLVAHRDGPDGTLGTADDDLFNSVAEVDRIKYVGTTALARLESYAKDKGFIKPGGGGGGTISPVSGTYDGVYFTLKQAELVLKLVNSAAQSVLDDDVPLDARAATNIVGLRPLATMKDLAAVSYVGGVALRLLRDYADQNQPVANCANTAACDSGYSCVGVPKNGVPKLGKCIDTKVVLPGEGNSCSSGNSCPSGLVCAGMLIWGQGDCVPEWMSGEFVSGGSGSIPDSPTSSGTASSVLVRGLASVPVDIKLKVSINHARPSDLRISLTDPNGDEAVVWDQKSGTLPSTFLVKGIAGDDEVNGQWRLRIQDRVAGTSGTHGGWSVYLTSRWD